MGGLPSVLRSLPDPAIRVGDGTEPVGHGGLDALELALGYRFSDRALLRVALTLGSWANEHAGSGWPSNACLEFFGDAVLDLAAADAIWLRFDNLDEGQLTRLRAVLVSEGTLAKAAERISLGDYLWLGRGDLKRGGRQHPSTLADAVEAVIGAAFLDAREVDGTPLPHVSALFDRLLGDELAALRPEHGVDPKSRLQHWAQAEHRVTPSYVRVGEDALPGPPIWRSRVELRHPTGRIEVLAEGEGRSLKRAERRAAALALVKLGLDEQVYE